MTERLLVLVRHGQSEWNLSRRFAGWSDIDLTKAGMRDARSAGRQLQSFGIAFDVGFSSALKRAQRTLDLALDEMCEAGIPVIRDPRLNERNYGELTGLSRDDAAKTWGEEQVRQWRRSYDGLPPGGETLRDVAARVLPCYIQDILPRVLRGERTLVAAHNNSLRALIMVLERLDAAQILARRLRNGAPVIYRLNADSTVAEVRDLAAT